MNAELVWSLAFRFQRMSGINPFFCCQQIRESLYASVASVCYIWKQQVDFDFRFPDHECLFSVLREVAVDTTVAPSCSIAGEFHRIGLDHEDRNVIGRPPTLLMAQHGITNRFDDHRPACTGRPVGGYVAKVVDDDMNDLPPGRIGRLAVRGPTGCRYLADARQKDYVCEGWNITGDSFSMDEEGYFHFAARNDDMIVSAGYNIAGPEVEAALLSHPAVAECAVIGAPDEQRGLIVEAHVVLVEGHEASPLTVRILQDHVKAAIAPYKYPRSVRFRDTLPKTQTGKIQRFLLRQETDG